MFFTSFINPFVQIPEDLTYAIGKERRRRGEDDLWKTNVQGGCAICRFLSTSDGAAQIMRHSGKKSLCLRMQ